METKQKTWLFENFGLPTFKDSTDVKFLEKHWLEPELTTEKTIRLLSLRNFDDDTIRNITEKYVVTKHEYLYIDSDSKIFTEEFKRRSIEDLKNYYRKNLKEMGIEQFQEQFAANEYLTAEQLSQTDWFDLFLQAQIDETNYSYPEYYDEWMVENIKEIIISWVFPEGKLNRDHFEEIIDTLYVEYRNKHDIQGLMYGLVHKYNVDYLSDADLLRFANSYGDYSKDYQEKLEKEIEEEIKVKDLSRLVASFIPAVDDYVIAKQTELVNFIARNSAGEDFMVSAVMGIYWNQIVETEALK